MAAKTAGQNIFMITAVFFYLDGRLPWQPPSEQQMRLPTNFMAQIPDVYSSQTTSYLYGGRYHS